MKDKVNFVWIHSERYQKGDPLSKHLNETRVSVHQSKNHTIPNHRTKRLHLSFFPNYILHSLMKITLTIHLFPVLKLNRRTNCNLCICINVDIKHTIIIIIIIIIINALWILD